MFTQNEYVAIQMNREAHTRALREAEDLRMLRAAGLLPESGLRTTGREIAGHLGRALVAVGQRLVRVEGPAAVHPTAVRSDSRA